MAAGMFSANKASNRSRFTPLSVERLENRDCPTSISLHASALTSGSVTFTGQITDGPSAGVHVQIMGSAWANAVTNADGTFSCVAQNPLPGWVYAVGVDDDQTEVTDYAMVDLTSTPPQIVITSIVNPNTNIWTITGTVTDVEDPEGFTVRFGGVGSLATMSATVRADGTFSLTFYLSQAESQSAFISATATDQWGMDSNTAYYMLM